MIKEENIRMVWFNNEKFNGVGMNLKGANT